MLRYKRYSQYNFDYFNNELNCLIGNIIILYISLFALLVFNVLYDIIFFDKFKRNALVIYFI